MPGYRTTVPGLSPDEARSLFVVLAGNPHADLGQGDALGSALRKVMASLPSDHQDLAGLVAERVLVDPSKWGSTQARPPTFDAVQAAVYEGRRAKLRYRGSGGAERGYTLDPLGLVNKSGTWYLVAEHRSMVKTFRVDRIQRATNLDTPARRRSGFDLASEWERLQREYAESLAAVPVRVRVRKRIVARVLRLHGDAAAEIPDPGDDPTAWVELTLRFPVLNAAQALLAHSDDLEVLDPPELRERFAELGRRITGLYS
jgi:predicted DNA-binding transcriptional regulator YafY